MKKSLLFFFTLCCLFRSNGQGDLDSLHQALIKAVHDTDKVLTMYRLGAALMNSHPDSSMMFAQQALKLATEKDYMKGEAIALALVGNNLWKKGDYSKAFEHHLAALKLFEQLRYDNGIVSTYNNLALIYEEQHDYQKATEYYLRAKDYYENLKEEKRTLADNERLLIVLMNIGNNFEKINKLDSALFYQGKAQALAITLKDEANIGNILTNLGNIYFKLEHTDLALSHYRSALPYLLKIDDKQILSEAYYGISLIFKSVNKPDSAILNANASLRYAREGNYTKGILYASQILADQYEKQNKVDSAFRYLKIALAIKDTLLDENDMREIQVLSMKEQLRQEGIALEKEKAKKERVENLQWLSIAIFIIVFFGILLLLGRSKTRPKSLKNLGLLGLLLFFEFISVFLHPFITHITHHLPIFTLLISVTIASMLVPFHHKMEHWIEHHFSHRKKRGAKAKEPTIKKITISQPEEKRQSE